MPRRTFFSFNYQRDIFRVNIVRNSNMIDGAAAAGWHDASLWEAAKARGPDAVRRIIDEGLQNTSVTVVCIGTDSADRRWINYEIDKSAERGNKLLGLRIHALRAPPTNQADLPGRVPQRLIDLQTRIISFTSAADLGVAIEALFPNNPKRILI